MKRNMSLCALTTVLASPALGVGTLHGHWKFNESSGTTAADSGPGSFNGTLNNAATFGAGGIEGNALVLPAGGGGFVEMPVIPINTPPLSISAWVKTTSASHSIVAGRHIATIVAGYFVALNNGGTYGLPGKAYGYVSAVPGQEPISSITVNDGQWHHVVMTFGSGSPVTLFVDGAFQASKPNPGFSPTPAPLLVGAVATTSGGRQPAYEGMIDDLQVYNGRLSGPQICAIFNNPGTPAPGACNGDVDMNNVVNFADLNLVLSSYGQMGFCLAADIDADGAVNFADLNQVLSAYGSSCTP